MKSKIVILCEKDMCKNLKRNWPRTRGFQQKKGWFRNPLLILGPIRPIWMVQSSYNTVVYCVSE